MRGGNGRRGLSGWVVLVVSIALVAVLAFAWVDAGRQPVRELVVPVPVPELPQ